MLSPLPLELDDELVPDDDEAELLLLIDDGPELVGTTMKPNPFRRFHESTSPTTYEDMRVCKGWLPRQPYNAPTARLSTGLTGLSTVQTDQLSVAL